ncbi:Na/Pi cotransporter family protein [Roseibium sp.]|uniref:Na/Pi cotransporter family protein n=1 Tax=Roseibium sp. TaxID=1936156 RepID=UPI003BAD40EA
MIILLNLAGALGLFLYGMKVMSDGLSELAGRRLRSTLGRLTSNRFKATFTGIFITCVIQSSSATTLMVVSFVNAGLLTLTGAIPVIMGANIGTTFTAWLIALLGFGVSMTAIAIPLMAIGFVLFSMSSSQARKWGAVIIGFSILFIGLEFMKGAVPDLQNNPAVYEFIEQVSGYGFVSTLLFLLIGTALTVVLQSSSATMAITIVAASQGWLPFEAATAIILGENIGTTITANLAALVANTNAKRAALAHLIVNVFGVIWALILLQPLVSLVDHSALLLSGGSPLTNAAAVPLGLALFHSIFNVLNVALQIGFVGPLAGLVTKAIPEKPDPEMEFAVPKYLTPSSMRYPETAIDAFLKESRRLYSNSIFEGVAHGLSLSRTQIQSAAPLAEGIGKAGQIQPYDTGSLFLKRIEPLFEEMLSYSSSMLANQDLSEEQRGQIQRIRVADRRMLDILKNSAILNRIATRETDNPNIAFLREMDSIRLVIGQLLRSLFALFEQAPETRTHAAFKALRKEAAQLDARIFEEVDMLIRRREITPSEGANLINASAISKHMSRDLVKVARTLFGDFHSIPT